MAFYLTDDGTMDTVVRCEHCGQEVRFNFDHGPDVEQAHCDEHAEHDGSCRRCRVREEEAGEEAYDAFCNECCEEAAADHFCPDAEEED